MTELINIYKIIWIKIVSYYCECYPSIGSINSRHTFNIQCDQQIYYQSIGNILEIDDLILQSVV
jgi:hypothetical protein